MMSEEPSSRAPIRVLMLGIGGAGFFAENSSDVVRHLAYLGRCGRGSRIDLLAYAPGQRMEPKHLEVEEGGQTLTVAAIGGSYFSYVKAMRPKAVHACETWAYDVIYCQDPFATAWLARWLSCRFKVPCIIGNHGSFFAAGTNWTREKPLFFRLLKGLARWNLRRGATRFQVLNEAEKAAYVRVGVPEKRIRITTTPVPLERFEEPLGAMERAAERERLGVPEGGVIVLWAGRPVRVKRVPWLMERMGEALALEPSLHFVLCGGVGEAQEDLETPASRLEKTGRFRWLRDGLDQAGLSRLYQSADIYVHTSLHEGLGRVMIEAGVCGLPVVATRSEGVERIVTDGETGRIVEAWDGDGFVQELLGLACDGVRRKEWGEAARQRMTGEFNETRCLESVVRVWYEAAEAGGLS